MIASGDYLAIANALGQTDALGDICYSFVNDLISVLDDTFISSQNTSSFAVLERIIASAGTTIYANHVTLAAPLNQMVVSLQKAATLTEPSVDAYLQANDIQVTPAFAALSAECGYPISPSNISS